MTALWPDSVVEEANLAYNISTLRKVLEDGGTGDSLIQTVPTKGYRFRAPVTLSQPAASARWNRRLLAGAALVLLAAAAAATFWVKSRWTTTPATSATSPIFMQLTATPAEMPVFSTAISPDGKYLAYSDVTAMHVQVIATGETQTLPSTWGRLLILGWNNDATQIRAVQTDTPVQTIWDVSLVGSARRRSGLVWPGEAVSLAPDGSSFLTIRQNGELRVEPVHGVAHSVLRFATDDFIRAPVWTSDAKRVFFLRGDPPTALETFAVQNGGPSVVFTAPPGEVIQTIGPPGRDGRLLALMGPRGRPGLVRFWQVPVSVDAGGRTQATH